MKRITAIILAILMLTAILGSCKGKGSPTVTTPSETDTPFAPTTPETEDTTDYALLVSAPFAELAENPTEDFAFLEENGEITITGYLGENTRVRIPEQIHQKPVTAIADGAFRAHAEITTLYIPDTVTRFGKNVLLGCKGIYALRTPLSTAEGTEYLGYLYGAISYETNNTADLRTLAYLELGGTCAELPKYALYDCNDIVCIKLPDTVTALAEYSLYRCESLKYINAEHLTRVGAHAMHGCKEMTDLAFGNALQEVGIGALEECASMRNLTLPFVGKSRTEQMHLAHLFGAKDPTLAASCYPASLRSVRLLEGCTAIGDHAFFDCATLRRVSIPNSVTSVGVRAFSGCARIEEITFSDALLTVREHAFSDCASLKTVTLGTGITSLGINAFLNCDALTEITLNAPALEELPSSCFVGCDGLKAVTLSGVKRISASAFRGCGALETVSLGDVTTVEENAFDGCEKLQTVTANRSVSFAKGNDLAKSLWKESNK